MEQRRHEQGILGLFFRGIAVDDLGFGPSPQRSPIIFRNLLKIPALQCPPEQCYILKNLLPRHSNQHTNLTHSIAMELGEFPSESVELESRAANSDSQWSPSAVKLEALKQFHLAAPVCVGLICNRFVSTTSTVLVGHQGATELAAVGLAVSLANVTGYSLLVGVAGTLQTTAGQAFGAKNWEEVSLSLQRCTMLCSLILCCIAMAWLNARKLLQFAGQEAEVSSLAASYLVHLLPGGCVNTFLGST